MKFGVQYNEVDIPFIRFTRAPFIDEQNRCFKQANSSQELKM